MDSSIDNRFPYAWAVEYDARRILDHTRWLGIYSRENDLPSNNLNLKI